MGNCVDLLAADPNAASLPDFKKTHSVCGKGAMAPDIKQNKTLYVTPVNVFVCIYIELTYYAPLLTKKTFLIEKING